MMKQQILLVSLIHVSKLRRNIIKNIIKNTKFVLVQPNDVFKSLYSFEFNVKYNLYKKEIILANILLILVSVLLFWCSYIVVLK